MFNNFFGKKAKTNSHKSFFGLGQVFRVWGKCKVKYSNTTMNSHYSNGS
jgi:hypothetical protein